MTMMKKEWSDLNWNKPLVDRMLGVAYQRVKQVQENLDKLEYFIEHLSAVEEGKESLDNLVEALNNPQNGLFIGKDMGTVGEDDPESITNGSNWVTTLVQNSAYFKPIYENINAIEKAGICIKEVVAISLALDTIKNVSDNLSTITDVNAFKDAIKITSNNLDKIQHLVDNIAAIVTVFKNSDAVSIVSDNMEILKNVSAKIHSLITVSDNINNIKQAISYYGVFKEVLDNKELLAVLADNKQSIDYIKNNSEGLTWLLDSQQDIDELAKYIDTFTELRLHIEDIHKVIDNIELIKEYTDMSDKITALYSALYPEAKRTTIDVDTDMQAAINEAQSGAILVLGKNINQNLTIPAGKTINLNLNGFKVTNASPTDTIKIELGASLYLYGMGTVDNTNKNCAPIFNNGSCLIKDTTITKSNEEYYAVLNHGRMVIGSGTNIILKDKATSSCIVNGYYDYDRQDERFGHIANINYAYPTLVINGGTFTGGRNTLKNDDGGICTVNGGTFTNKYDLEPTALGAALFNVHQLTINYAVVNAENLYAIYNRYYNNRVDKGTVIINSGNFTGTVMNHNSKGSITVNGGTFNPELEQGE